MDRSRTHPSLCRAAERITRTFRPLAPLDHEARESLAANWLERLAPCKNEADVVELLDKLNP